ncbi:hypothetical protein CYMTET_7393 [Cymbomonas tetramitiformis]|uniref:Uncharacterized protein n=1 Tax=Cymbomonas tetramitiformis TaxID=36881 RepID=A0AAE0LHH8_9CHLO|nr:hypothetical protein CYMTET_7393 [Cymbomonas tetramitiformis]
MYKECCNRFFNTFMDCKLEDFAMATFLDPQRKSFKFKYVNRWKRGTLTGQQGIAWAKRAYEENWKTKHAAGEDDSSQRQNKVMPAGRESFLSDSEDEDEVSDLVQVEEDPALGWTSSKGVKAVNIRPLKREKECASKRTQMMCLANKSSRLEKQKEDLVANGRIITSADTARVLLAGYDLCKADLTKADLSCAYLCWTDLSNAKLEEAVLIKARCVEQSLRRRICLEQSLRRINFFTSATNTPCDMGTNFPFDFHTKAGLSGSAGTLLKQFSTAFLGHNKPPVAFMATT